MRVPSIVVVVVGAIVEIVLAGALIGGIEAVRIIADSKAGFQIGTWAVLAALEGVGAIACAALILTLLAALRRVPAIARWTDDLAAAGEARVVAVWRAVLATAGVAIGAAAIYAIASRTHVAFRLNEGDTVGLLVAAVVTPVVCAIAIGIVAIDKRVRPRIAGSVRLADLLTRRGWIVAAVAAVAVAYGPSLLVGAAVPALELERVRAVSLLVVFVVIARGARIGTRRWAQVAAGVALIACLVGAWQLSSAERARGLVVVHGAFGERVAHTMWSMGDRDGDGYPSTASGGSDCDDDDPRRYPTALEIAGNGIDENCSGSDANVAALGERDVPRPTGKADAAKYNIVLITVDALRADHLGAYGYERPTSPAIDALAQQALVFGWAMTPCPATRCSIPALMTGRLPGVDWNVDSLPFAAVLRNAGWDTAAITSYFRFTSGGAATDGFGTVDASADVIRFTRGGQSTADHVADKALRWIDSRARDPRPYMLWLHFFDPHHPYEAPDGNRFGRRDVDRYDAEIAYTDHHIGRVLAALDPAKTIIVLTADHGEAFGEHGLRFHGRSLYNTVVRVPLIVRYPGALSRPVITPVSLVDVAPTLLDLVGVAGPPGMNGRSFARAVREPAEPAARPLLLGLVPDSVIRRDMAGLVYGQWKVLWDREANAWSLFQFAADPAERHDQAAAQPVALQDMQRRLFEAMDRELARPPLKKP